MVLPGRAVAIILLLMSLASTSCEAKPSGAGPRVRPSVIPGASSSGASACQPVPGTVAAGDAVPYRPGGGVLQLRSRITVAVHGAGCRLPVAPAAQLLDRGRPVGSMSLSSPLSTPPPPEDITSGRTLTFWVVWTPGTDGRCRATKPVTGIRVYPFGGGRPVVVPLPHPSSECLLDTVYTTYPR